jgi:hypothetical protein
MVHEIEASNADIVMVTLYDRLFGFVTHTQYAHVGKGKAVREISHQRLGELQLAMVTK